MENSFTSMDYLLTLKPEYKGKLYRYNPKTREKVVVPTYIKGENGYRSRFGKSRC